MNHATITGQMGKPAALAYTKSGQAVLSFSIADTPRRKNQQTGEWEDAGETLWCDVSVWGDDAEALAEQMGDFKGKVTVTGRLGWRSWEDKQTGAKRGTVTLRADSIAMHPRFAAKTDRQQGHSGGWGSQGGDPWSTGGGQQTGGWGQQPDGQPFTTEENPF